MCAGHGLGGHATAHHSSELSGLLIVAGELAYGHEVATVATRRLFDDEVMVGERRDLCQVRDDEHLVTRAERLQPHSNLDGGLAADARVDLVENESRNPIHARAD